MLLPVRGLGGEGECSKDRWALAPPLDAGEPDDAFEFLWALTPLPSPRLERPPICP